MINGIVNIYKEKGFTSFDVVAKLRGVFHQKKIGHTGTLDPDAEGVLPVCLGRATKVCDLLTDKDKEYEAVLLLGQQTDTQDVTGQVLATAEVNVTEEEVLETIASFVGDYMQIPPMYSALKVNGQKLYDLARQGITVERKARPVTIFGIDVLDVDLPRVRMRVHCSKGTYIRTLCQDIGDKLGCFGCMESLLRTRVACFDLQNAIKIRDLEAVLAENEEVNLYDIMVNEQKIIMPVDALFPQCPPVMVKEEGEKLLVNGNRIPMEFLLYKEEDLQDQIRVYDWNNRFIGIYAYRPELSEIKPVKIFVNE